MTLLQSPNLGLFSQHKLIQVMTQFCLKHGKKSLAIKLVNDGFINFLNQVSSNTSYEDIIGSLESKIVSRVGFFKRRLGSKSYRIPYVLTWERAYRLSVKRFHKFVLKANTRGYSTTLTKELINLHNNTGAFITENAKMLQEANEGRTLMYMIKSFKLKNPDAFNLELMNERYESRV